VLCKQSKKGIYILKIGFYFQVFKTFFNNHLLFAAALLANYFAGKINRSAGLTDYNTHLLCRHKGSSPQIEQHIKRCVKSSLGALLRSVDWFCGVSCIERECVDQKLIMNRLHTWILISKNWPLLIMPIFVVCGITLRFAFNTWWRSVLLLLLCCYCWWVNADNRIWKAGVLWERGRIWNKAHAGVWSFGVLCRHSGLLFGNTLQCASQFCINVFAGTCKFVYMYILCCYLSIRASTRVLIFLNLRSIFLFCKDKIWKHLDRVSY